MLFDRSKLKGKKEEKIAIGALKYIAIKVTPTYILIIGNDVIEFNKFVRKFFT